MEPSQTQPRFLAWEFLAGANQILTLCWEGQIKAVSALLLENREVFKRLGRLLPPRNMGENVWQNKELATG